VEADKFIRLREWADILDTTITAGEGEDSCEGVGDNNEEVGRERISFSEALVILNVIPRPPINKDG